MIVEFLLYSSPFGWFCIATKNLTVVPQEGTTVKIKEEGSSRTMTYKVKCVELDVDFPKYIVYLS